jgi:hypothetical protein
MEGLFIMYLHVEDVLPLGPLQRGKLERPSSGRDNGRGCS